MNALQGRQLNLKEQLYYEQRKRNKRVALQKTNLKVNTPVLRGVTYTLMFRELGSHLVLERVTFVCSDHALLHVLS